MSTFGERYRNTSPVFRVLLMLLLAILLLLLCLLVFLQFLLPMIRPTPQPTTPVATTPPVVTVTPTGTPATPQSPTATPTQVVLPTGTGGPTTGTPAVTPSTPQPTQPAPVTGTPATAVPTTPVTPVVEIRNLLINGDFEAGFQPNELGKYWNSFNNGRAAFSFHIDDWPLVVVQGKNTQLIEIKNAQEQNRYLGMYQTADVIAGQVYTFSMRGLVRTNTGDVQQTSYGYRLEVGFDLNGGQDWKTVEDWVELPWDDQLRVQDSFRFDSYTTRLTAKSDKLTVFIRAWKKWADSGEGDYDVDDIQLVGPTQVTPSGPGIPVTGGGAESIWENVRVWATIALLLLLIGGAIWRAGWRKS
jgi:hypothetical protein